MSGTTYQMGVVRKSAVWKGAAWPRRGERFEEGVPLSTGWLLTKCLRLLLQDSSHTNRLATPRSS